MVFDLDLIKNLYGGIPSKVDAARKLVGTPLTLAEKILYSHLFVAPSKAYVRGKDYVDFAPDRVAMQDATAQMALLQFMTAGLPQTALTSVSVMPRRGSLCVTSGSGGDAVSMRGSSCVAGASLVAAGAGGVSTRGSSSAAAEFLCGTDPVLGLSVRKTSCDSDPEGQAEF